MMGLDLAEAPEIRAAHPLGVYPLGNALLDEGASVRRTNGLGRFSKLGDEHMLELLRALPSEICSRFACTSATLRAFAWHDDIWQKHCLQLVDAGNCLVWDGDSGTWRGTYVRSRTPSSGNSPPRSSAPSREKSWPSSKCSRARVYSDVLYRSFFCAAVELDSRWFLRETIARVDSRGLSAEDFVRRFEQRSCPVILEGCVESWPAMKSWSRERLLERFANVPFTCGPCDMSLGEFYNYAGSNLDEAPLFVFDRLFGKRAPALLNDYEVPDVFRGRDLFDLLGEATRPDFRWLLIGNRRSGSKWHVDPNKTSAWNAVVRGRKRWILLPPGCAPPGVHPSKDGAEVTQPVSLIEWFVNFYKELRKFADDNPSWDLKEGVCGPGDAVFVPCGWWHCVINLEDDTIAVTQNYAAETHMHSIRRFLHEKRCQVSGTHDKLTLAERFDAALASHRPDLLAQPDPGDLGKGPSSAHASSTDLANSQQVFSFWDHLRSSGRTLGFSNSAEASTAVDQNATFAQKRQLSGHLPNCDNFGDDVAPETSEDVEPAATLQGAGDWLAGLSTCEDAPNCKRSRVD